MWPLETSGSKGSTQFTIWTQLSVVSFLSLSFNLYPLKQAAQNLSFGNKNSPIAIIDARQQDADCARQLQAGLIFIFDSTTSGQQAANEGQGRGRDLVEFGLGNHKRSTGRLVVGSCAGRVAIGLAKGNVAGIDRFLLPS